MTDTTTTSASLGDVREDLEKVAYKVGPTTTPFTNAIGKATATANKHEWTIAEIRAARTTPAFKEGGRPEFEQAERSKVSNFVQQYGRSFKVTGRARAVATTTSQDEVAYQTIDAAVTVKRDMEASFLSNSASIEETANVAYTSAGALSFIETNSNRGAGGADGGYSAGLVSAPTDAITANTRAFSETIFRDVVAQIYNTTGETASLIAFVSPAQKQKMASFAGVAANRVNTPANGLATIVDGVDVIMTDFGSVRLQPSVNIRSRDCLIINPQYWAVGTLTAMKTDDLAKDGDADAKMVTARKTLVSRNEAASGVAADLN